MAQIAGVKRAQRFKDSFESGDGAFRDMRTAHRPRFVSGQFIGEQPAAPRRHYPANAFYVARPDVRFGNGDDPQVEASRQLGHALSKLLTERAPRFVVEGAYHPVNGRVVTTVNRLKNDAKRRPAPM